MTEERLIRLLATLVARPSPEETGRALAEIVIWHREIRGYYS